MEFSELVGVTLVSVEGARPGSEEIVLSADDGRKFSMQHFQDCCEHVEVIDVVGDVEDIIGTPIVSACEESSEQRPVDLPKPDYQPESETWTLYRIATVKGVVVLRWQGRSNGYYSERVAFGLVGGERW